MDKREDFSKQEYRTAFIRKLEVIYVEYMRALEDSYKNKYLIWLDKYVNSISYESLRDRHMKFVQKATRLNKKHRDEIQKYCDINSENVPDGKDIIKVYKKRFNDEVDAALEESYTMFKKYVKQAKANDDFRAKLKLKGGK